MSQAYSYDGVNRLWTSTETNVLADWAEQEGYDQWGNRWVQSQSNLPALTTDVPIAASSFNTANNRINSLGYDKSGNANAIASQNMTYDAENHQITATGAGANAQYSYDGDGRRVLKVLNGVTTIYVYDAAGQLAAEYSTQPPPSDCGTPVCYFDEDHLGSTRLVTDSNGNVAKRYDYLPFGEEIFAGFAGRTTAMGYQSATAPDPLNPKFTGKLCDNETDLDYFGARYFSSPEGRWTSPDNPMADQHLENPQS